MSDTDLQVATLPALTSKDLLARVERIHEVQQKVMKRDVDYGIIPGCQKPSLYKSGAEILLQTFEMAALPEQADVQDLGNADEIRYRVIVPIIHIPTGRVVGHGVGECSSNEDKYKWRKMVCEQEFEETDPARRRIIWKHGRGGIPYQVKQIRTNPADLANTILKMSKKRGLVDGTMTVTAASRHFTQDVEDLPREYLEQGEPQPSRIPQVRPRNDATMVQPATDKYTGQPLQNAPYGAAESALPVEEQHRMQEQASQASDAPAVQKPQSAAEFARQKADETPDLYVDGYLGNIQPYSGKTAFQKGCKPGVFDIEDTSGHTLLMGVKYFDPTVQLSSGAKRVHYRIEYYKGKEQYNLLSIEEM